MSYDLFENIEYQNLENLFNICKKDSNFIDGVRIEYLKKNQFFLESLNFLIDINLINITKNSVSILSKPNIDFSSCLFTNLSKNTEYALFLKNYLSNFINQNSSFSFKPNPLYNNLTSDLRNFLISSNKITYENEEYSIIDNELLDLFKNKEFSPEQLQKILENKNKIGLEAEELVVKYETGKIKNFNRNLEIDHVALRDVSAGYDIKSYEIDGANIKEIFIEVKAVSISNYKFHLSMQENQTANKFLDRYYLYLLPVDHSNPEKFDYNKLLRINNVNKSILQNKKDWIIEEDGFVISKKL
ncbi:DUF3883 domain-containing protein [Candidatus Pelagibacter sp.]|jgi:hypothetical protein|nr:DUF3883 domain-containing protein [Candidatus Pelagibacter sp.]|tara:strand:+ start:135 stop:1037 length:903 start_codon:yes stop_codon:yes gene_type:complete